MSYDERNEEINVMLESRFDQLNQVIANHEAKLKAMMIAQDTHYVFRKGERIDEHGQKLGIYRWYIGMLKYQGAWRLCYGHEYETYTGGADSDGIDWKPLADCSVDERLSACPHIKKLKEEIVSKKESLVPKLEKTISDLVKALE